MKGKRVIDNCEFMFGFVLGLLELEFEFEFG